MFTALKCVFVVASCPRFILLFNCLPIFRPHALQLYRISNGNVNVKSTDRKNAELYKWIVQLRKDYKTRERDPAESPLTEDQISVLESVRFAFTTRGEEHWQKNYEKLKEYKNDHGHVLVPRQCEIPGLGDWVTSQRQQYQEYTKGRPTPLTKQRKELLDEIGFQFRIRNRPEWSSKYDELLQYKEKNGDTRVPQHFKANKALGKVCVLKLSRSIGIVLLSLNILV